nr:TetR/AcrR family transcriptional regulator [Streptomyces sp. NBC_00830]
MSGVNRQQGGEKLQAVMQAALGVFGRYGYSKTSMEAVAKAAGISRPGLYLLFPNKGELYRATMQDVLERAQVAAEARLAEPGRSVEERITAAMDELVGQYVETQLARDIDHLLQTSELQLGGLLDEYQAKAEKAVAAAFEEQARGVPGFSAPQVADVLFAAALSWKHRVADRADFRDRVALLVRLFCHATR